MDARELLEALRDIHEPAPVGWWPPAPGWWLLGAAALVPLAALLVRRHRRRAPRREALRELRRLDRAFRRDRDAHALAAGLSALLRRAALAGNPRPEVAGLCGEDWLAWLDGRVTGAPFRDGPGRALASEPYRREAELSPRELIRLAGRWIRRGL